MKVRVLSFASAREALGAAELEVELPEGSRVADLEAVLVARHPGLAPLWPRLAIAVGGELAKGEVGLTEGAEVALLPPVSGGSSRRRARLQRDPLSLAGLAAEVSAPERGAALLFVGTARDHLGGRAVTHLTYDAYLPLAERVLESIAADLEADHAGLRVVLAHRLGEVPAGEASVVIAVSAPHRGAAYAASRQALERLKREAPIWKREHFADGGAEWREVEALRQ